VSREGGEFVIRGAREGLAEEVVHARRVILATGGKALPKTGSDGHGYLLVRSLGHTTTNRIFPALVPLTLPREHFLCALSGISAVATLELRAASGRRLASFTNSTLCTHFGISGPGPLDISRYYTDGALDAIDRGESPPSLVVNWLPRETAESLDRRILEHARSGGKAGTARFLRECADGASALPERLIHALCEHAAVPASLGVHQLTRDQRQAVVRAFTELRLPVSGDRGYTHAEVTAGGVPLDELNLKTMESRVAPGLYLCGEICDVDGRIGGFNFQWAWASGFVAGTSAAESLIAR
jgi:predicted Rossmann fold flavoprotein